MRAVEQPPHSGRSQLAELLVSAATELAASIPSTPTLTLPGAPVRSGRLSLGRLRRFVPTGTATVVVGFGTAAWVGDPAESSPDLGRLSYRGEVTVDPRGRVVLDRRARAWLGVEDPSRFDAVALAAGEGGVLVVPVEGFARRFEAVAR